jgi:hypothetical protein
MEAQWLQRRQGDARPFSGAAPASPSPRVPGEVSGPRPQPGFGPVGSPVSPVDFFRRMPGGGTAYLRPVEDES